MEMVWELQGCVTVSHSIIFYKPSGVYVVAYIFYLVNIASGCLVTKAGVAQSSVSVKGMRKTNYIKQ